MFSLKNLVKIFLARLLIGLKFLEFLGKLLVKEKTGKHLNKLKPFLMYCFQKCCGSFPYTVMCPYIVFGSGSSNLLNSNPYSKSCRIRTHNSGFDIKLCL